MYHLNCHHITRKMAPSKRLWDKWLPIYSCLCSKECEQIEEENIILSLYSAFLSKLVSFKMIPEFYGE